MHPWGRCCAPSHVVALHAQLRFARTRGSKGATVDMSQQHARRSVPMPPEETVHKPPAPMPAGVLKRQSGFVSADTPSIASIRAELDALRSEKLFAAQVKAQASVANNPRRMPNDARIANRSALQAKAMLPTPSYSLQDKRLAEGILANASLHDKRLCNDVQDVVRRRRASDGVRLALLAGQLHTTAMQAKREAALNEVTRRVTATLQGFAMEGSAAAPMVAQDTSSSDPLYEAALLDVIDKAAPDEVLEWLRFGLVDPLWWATSASDGERNAGDGSDDDDSLAAWLAEADPLRVLSAAHAANSYSSAAVHALRLKDVPSPDIAPAVIKADRGDFGSITERELQSLEAHEAQNANLVGRAFTPSSPLMAALATVDDKLKASLDIMERTKRGALLDSSFQAALDYVNTLHDARHASIARVNPRQRKAAAEVPFFFGSNRSQPPPAADMNLPAPKASPEERASLRRKRKLHRLRQRFST